VSAKGRVTHGDADGQGAAKARPVRKTRTAKTMRNFYGAPAKTRTVKSVGRHADRDYDPETGRKRER
jgi:hypothetical protein